MHITETLKGALAANVAVAGYAWIADNVSLSAFSAVFTLAITIGGYIVLRKEKAMERESRRVGSRTQFFATTSRSQESKRLPFWNESFIAKQCNQNPKLR